jgi:hypothetical protein
MPGCEWLRNDMVKIPYLIGNDNYNKALVITNKRWERF